MNIFILVYHFVRKILLLPKTIIEDSKKRKIERQLYKEKEARKRKLIEETIGEVDSKSKTAANSNLFQFNYRVRNKLGKIFTGTINAKTKLEVETFLKNENYEIIKIEPKKNNALNTEINFFGKKIKGGELSFMLTQLSTYIKAGIPLVDSVRILSRQETKAYRREQYDKIVYDLVSGEKFSKALDNQRDIFPKLLTNMVKASELTGDLPETLDAMADYYQEMNETKRQMISALIYPIVVFTVSILVVIFCLVYVVPNFVKMYAETDSSLPGITVFVMNLSNFLSKNWIFILLMIVSFILIFILLYKYIKSFRRSVQIITMKLPVFGKIVIYSEVSMFTRTFAQLLNHSVKITDTMIVLQNISNNEVYKDIITDTLECLSKGGKISESYKNHWAFPVVAYEMLVTGESTGKLGDMMQKVADHYSNLHKNAISTIKSLLEPVTIIFLAFAVGFILLSIVIPMFDIYGAVGSLN